MSSYGTGRAALGVVCGAILVLSSLAHALLGWPAMRVALGQIGASGALSGALAVGWYFGSVAMLVFGLIVLDVALRRADPRVVRFLAVGYLAFGITAWVARDFNPHFLLFIATGVLLALFSFPRFS